MVEILKSDRDFWDNYREPVYKCPDCFREERLFEFDGETFKLFYNYVPPGGFGMRPMNCWWIILKGRNDYRISLPLTEHFDKMPIDEIAKDEVVVSLLKKAVGKMRKRIAEKMTVSK